MVDGTRVPSSKPSPNLKSLATLSHGWDLNPGSGERRHAVSGNVLNHTAIRPVPGVTVEPELQSNLGHKRKLQVTCGKVAGVSHLQLASLDIVVMW